MVVDGINYMDAEYIIISFGVLAVRCPPPFIILLLCLLWKLLVIVLTLASLNPSELKKYEIPGVIGFNNCYLFYFQHFQIFISYNYFMKHQFQT
jgi:hypothetical protein